MLTALKESLWKHLGASIDMLKNAIEHCPEEYWQSNRQFCYMAYHTTLYIHYYLTMPPLNFSVPLPYTLTDPANLPAEAVDDSLPNRIYSKQEILTWLQAGRDKCRQTIDSLTEERLSQQWAAGATAVELALSDPRVVNDTVLDVLLLNVRHVQHHTAQMNLLLRQTINDAPDWVAHADFL